MEILTYEEVANLLTNGEFLTMKRCNEIIDTVEAQAEKIDSLQKKVDAAAGLVYHLEWMVEAWGATFNRHTAICEESKIALVRYKEAMK